MAFGARLRDGGGVTFRLWAPAARQAELAIEGDPAAAAKVPSGVKAPTCSSYSTVSCQGRPVQELSHSKAPASTTRLAPCGPCGLCREAGSGTSSAPSMRHR